MLFRGALHRTEHLAGPGVPDWTLHDLMLLCKEGVRGRVKGPWPVRYGGRRPAIFPPPAEHRKADGARTGTERQSASRVSGHDHSLRTWRQLIYLR